MTRASIEFSAVKNRKNLQKHGISLERANEFDFTTALDYPDDSHDYGEERNIALGFLAGNLYLMVYVQMTGSHIRVISLRKATRSEEFLYANN